ncbi:MAG TPA: hypothetical protein VNZ27_15720 [Rhodanobacter sp.]|nr:hypothetical protein [Rhodanobacter sp.]
MSEVRAGASICAAIDHQSGDAVSLRAAYWLGLAAAPTFALMALLSGALGGGSMDMFCSSAHGASPLSGMTLMYVLMSVFHSASWLKWIARRRRGIR